MRTESGGERDRWAGGREGEWCRTDGREMEEDTERRIDVCARVRACTSSGSIACSTDVCVACSVYVCRAVCRVEEAVGGGTEAEEVEEAEEEEVEARLGWTRKFKT